jgi:NitT/TauT family transport system substrate-binding protein
VHPGCLELFANDRIQRITDLKGKRVGVDDLYSSPHLWVSLMAAYVGLDPVNDIEWVKSQEPNSMQLFIDGKIDAFLAIAPEPQELRARKIGHTILSSSIDRPWSQYFCCMMAGHVDYVRRHPVATKHVLRSILKATDLCASAPKWAAQQLVDGGFTPRHDFALQTLIELPYGRWREYDTEDSLRFYALRMHEAGLTKAAPQKIIAEGTDWRFIEELKRELKT